MARGPGCDRPRPRVPAPLTPGQGGITSVGCSCDSARPPAGSSRTGPSTSSVRSRCSPRRTTPTGSPAASRTTPARRRPRSTTRATRRHRAHAPRLHRAQRADRGRRALGRGHRGRGCTSTPTSRHAGHAGLHLPAPQPSFYFVRNMFMVAMGIALVGYTRVPDRAAALAPRVGLHRHGGATSPACRRTASRSTRSSTRTPRCPRCTSAFALMLGVPIARWSSRAVAQGLLGAATRCIVDLRGRRHRQPLRRRRVLGACTAGLARARRAACSPARGPPPGPSRPRAERGPRHA